MPHPLLHCSGGDKVAAEHLIETGPVGIAAKAAAEGFNVGRSASLLRTDVAR
jgi:hypothetical protein